MKIKWLNPLMISCLSTAFVALGFGSCKTKGGAEITQKRNQLVKKIASLSGEIKDKQLKLQQKRSEYENIGRAECVYGGPNMMEQIRERESEKQNRYQQETDALRHDIDSLKNEREKVAQELDQIKKMK